jgi:hypothetical protein
MEDQFITRDAAASMRSAHPGESLCETLIVLGTVVAICVSVINLAAHLDNSLVVRGKAESGSRTWHNTAGPLHATVADNMTPDASRLD